MNCAHFIIFRPKQTNFKINIHETSALNFWKCLYLIQSCEEKQNVYFWLISS